MNKILFTLAAAALITGAAAVSNDADAAAPRSLTVSGSATVSVLPDTATLYVIVESEGKDAAQAARDNAARTDKVWTAVTAAGADREASATAGYNLWPEYEAGKPGTIKTYRVTNGLKVVTHDLSAAGKISDAALKAGASRIQSVQFSLEKEEQYQTAALSRAASEARKKADIIAQSLGTSVTGVLSVTASAPSSGTYRFRMMSAAMDSAGAAPTELTPEKQDITRNVTVVFQIQ